jgi:hypothetical protein
MRTFANGSHSRHADPVESLRRDLGAIKRDVSSLVGGGWGAASDRTKELLDQTRERAGEVHKKLGEAAAARPLTTIALAAAGGAIGAKIVGLMLRR